MSDPITPLNPTQVSTEENQAASEGYLLKDAVGLDQFVNVLLDGNPDETISSRMARWSTEDSGFKKEIGDAVSKGLDLLQKDHGADAEAGDTERAAAVTKIESSTGDL